MTDNATEHTKTHDKEIWGFSPVALARIQEAQKLNQIAIYIIYVAIIAFVVFGTIASLQAFHDNKLLYQLFYYLPYVLVALTIPITLYDAFVLYRYRLSQPSMLLLCIGVAMAITIFAIVKDIAAFWLAMAAWMGAVFLFKANFKRFFAFIDSEEMKDKKNVP